MNDKYSAYIHISPTKKVYIGITCKNPKYRWDNGKGYCHNKYFTNAINKYGWDNFKHIIIAKNLSKSEAEWIEIELIKAFNSTDKSKGYNLATGGYVNSGYKLSNETRNKMSESRKGRHGGFEGKSHSCKTKEKISQSLQGSKSYRARKIICINTGKIFNSIVDASEEMGLNYNTLKNSMRTGGKCKGFQFSYYE